MFKVPNLRHNLDEDMLIRLMVVIPRSYLERGTSRTSLERDTITFFILRPFLGKSNI